MKTITLVLVLCTIILHTSVGQDAVCPQSCDRALCTDYECPGGSFAKDACGCCDVCVRGVGEVCGGQHDRLGRCDKTLTCVDITTEAFMSDQASDDDREENEERVGVCEGAQDCIVSAWSSWTKCSAQCGIGIMRRKRVVLQIPKNGGKPCPAKHEKKGCFQQKCTGNMVLAQILPAMYRRLPAGSYEYESILPLKKSLTQIQKIRKSFRSHCVNFKLMSKHPYCHGTWAEKLKISKPLCVECQPAIMDNQGFCKGEGIAGNFTSWVATDTKTCSGLWMRVGEKIPNCKCTNQHFQNFIFV